MQSVVIKGQSTSKGTLPIRTDDDGNLIIQLEGATVNIGDVDVASIAAGDNNIGNVDLASAIPAGTALIGKVGIDQVTANANEVVVKSSALPTDASTHTGQDEQSVKLDSIIAALAQLAALQDKVIGEVVNEVPNGVNDTFTVDYAFAANSEQVVVNRQVMTRGASYDYVPTGASNQIVFNAGSIPAATATIQVSYWKA